VYPRPLLRMSGLEYFFPASHPREYNYSCVCLLSLIFGYGNDIGVICKGPGFQGSCFKIRRVASRHVTVILSQWTCAVQAQKKLTSALFIY